MLLLDTWDGLERIFDGFQQRLRVGPLKLLTKTSTQTATGDTYVVWFTYNIKLTIFAPNHILNIVLWNSDCWYTNFRTSLTFTKPNKKNLSFYFVIWSTNVQLSSSEITWRSCIYKKKSLPVNFFFIHLTNRS